MALSLDQKLSVTNTITQICILFLALFGYFYTVIPLYSKAILEEQIAKIQIDIEKKNKIIDIKEKELVEIQKKAELAQQGLRANTKIILQEKIFSCFIFLQIIPTFDYEKINVSEKKSEEIIKSKEYIFECVRDSLVSLTLDDENKKKLLQDIDNNKLNIFLKFDKHAQDYISTIKEEYELFKKSQNKKLNEINKYKKSNPQKYKLELMYLNLNELDFIKKDKKLFSKFLVDALNDYQL